MVIDFLRFWGCLGYALFCHGAIGLLGGFFWQREDLENSFFMHNVVQRERNGHCFDGDKQD